jgi:hypothetical protein
MQFAHSLSPRARVRRGLTLVEMLVAMTCTILLMFAITQTFQSIGEVSAKGRAAIEMSTQLRGVQHRLHKDFESLTVPVRPWPEAGAGEGYLEILEGGLVRDNTYHGTSFDLYGDFDDIWAMTIRSTGEPFVGRFNGGMIQSHLAEVIWFTSFVDRDGSGTFNDGEPLNLHRRVLLIRPDLDASQPGFGAAQVVTFWQNNDLSVHANGTTLVANSLADLTLRQNRFAHFGNFPSAISVTGGFLTHDRNDMNNSLVLSGDRTGEDVMLSNVLAADIRVYDPDAPIRSDGTDPLVPGDPGFRAATATIGFGAYVDLGYNEGANGRDDNKDGSIDESAEGSYFNTTEMARYTNFTSGYDANGNNTIDAAERAPLLSLRPAARSGIGSYVYDTWSYWYEHDGVDQIVPSMLPSGDMDQATNGIDDNNTNGIDDVGERETSPPYPVPLRGVQVRIRVLEVETSQVRQATVVQDFIPE